MSESTRGSETRPLVAGRVDSTHLAGISKSGGRRFGLKQQTLGVKRFLVAMLSLVDTMDEQFQVNEYSSLFAFDHGRDLVRIETGCNVRALVTNGRAATSSPAG
jgi:hypothetical protein